MTPSAADRFARVLRAQRQGDLEEALRGLPALLEALAAPDALPDRAAGSRLLFVVAGTLHALGRLAEAESLCRTALAFDPAAAAAANLLGVLEGRPAPHRGLRWLTRALAVDPVFEDARINQARLAIRAFDEATETYRCGRLDEAEALCRGLLHAAADHATAAALLRLIARARRGEPIPDRRDGIHPLPAHVPRPQPRPVWAVVTGAVRNPPEFLGIVRWLAAIRSFGLLDGILVSTWTGHVSGNAVLAAELEGMNVGWVETDEPRVAIKWNTIQQMVSLERALAACPPEADVLKLRTDKIHDRFHELFVYDTLLRRDRLEAARPDGPLTGRLVVPNASLLAPFHYKDMVFFGRGGDVRRLINFDVRHLFVHRHMSSEQWFFARPFLAPYPIFDVFFQVWAGHAVSHRGNRAFFDAFREDPFFTDVFAANLHVLATWFHIGGHARNADVFAEARADLERRTLLRAMDDLAVAPMLITAYYDHWIPSVLAGRFVEDAFGRRVRAGLERVADPAFQALYAAPGAVKRPEVRAFAALAERTVTANAGRGDVWRTTPAIVDIPDFWKAV